VYINLKFILQTDGRTDWRNGCPLALRRAVKTVTKQLDGRRRHFVRKYRPPRRPH